MRTNRYEIMKKYPLINQTSLKILSILITRAITGTLKTKPKKKFSKKQLDYSNAKGRTIGSFLKRPTDLFPAPNHMDRMKRMQFILSTLALNGVDINQELEDIKTEITPLDFPIDGLLEFIDTECPNDPQKDKIICQQRTKILELEDEIARLKFEIKCLTLPK